MTPSEESMTLMTSYHFPHHGHRFFSGALNDVFRSPLLVTYFPKIVILNGGKNAVQEKRETTT